MVTQLKLDEQDYPVNFLNGKLSAAVLRIQKTSDEIMDKLKLGGKNYLTCAH